MLPISFAREQNIRGARLKNETQLFRGFRSSSLFYIRDSTLSLFLFLFIYLVHSRLMLTTKFAVVAIAVAAIAVVAAAAVAATVILLSHLDVI